MEVDNNRIVPPATAGSSQGAPVDNQKKDDTGHSSQTPKQTEQLSLTDTSRQLHELEKLIASQPVVDSKRVEAIREAIATDNFNVDADSIADKLMRIEQALTDTR